jgi:hypothetical protein
MPGFGATLALHVSIVAACAAGHTDRASIITATGITTCSDCDTQAVGNDITSPSTTFTRENRSNAVQIRHGECQAPGCLQITARIATVLGMAPRAPEWGPAGWETPSVTAIVRSRPQTGSTETFPLQKNVPPNTTTTQTIDLKRLSKVGTASAISLAQQKQ